uniref:Reverse transcriptase domain-containing protein n=1 Tax=Aegilops tauschii subsp. strangulata TaxID=200361 RepID=A0A453N3P2_AEGTS
LGLLANFGEATGLHLNQSKSSLAAIRCDDVDLPEVLQSFGGSLVDFPMTYLGLPISTTRLRLIHFQFILDRIKARLAGWKGRLLNLAGRRVL